MDLVTPIVIYCLNTIHFTTIGPRVDEMQNSSLFVGYASALLIGGVFPFSRDQGMC